MTKKQIDTILSSNIPKRWNTSQSYVISNEHGTIEIMSRAACEGLAMMVDEMKANNNSVCAVVKHYCNTLA